MVRRNYEEVCICLHLMESNTRGGYPVEYSRIFGWWVGWAVPALMVWVPVTACTHDGRSLPFTSALALAMYPSPSPSIHRQPETRPTQNSTTVHSLTHTGGVEYTSIPFLAGQDDTPDKPFVRQTCNVPNRGIRMRCGVGVYRWYIVGIWLVYGWYMVGIRLVYGWYMVGIWLVYGWYMVGGFLMFNFF